MKIAAYIAQDGAYFEAIHKGDTPVDIADGRVMVPLRPDRFHDWDGSAWVENAQRIADAAMTPAKLDALAERVATNELEDNMRSRAMGMVMADLIENVFGVSQAVARAQVKSRFKDYYRALLDE